MGENLCFLSVFMFLSTHSLAVNNVRYSLPSNNLKNLNIYFLAPYSFPSPCSRYNGTCQSCTGSLRKLNSNFRMAGLRQIILTKNKFSLANICNPVGTHLCYWKDIISNKTFALYQTMLWLLAHAIFRAIFDNSISAKVYWKIIFSHKKVISQGHATRISMLFMSCSMIDWSKK